LEAIQPVGIGNPPGPGGDELVRDVGAQVLYTTARVPGIDVRKNGEMIGWAAPCGPLGVKSDMPWKLMLPLLLANNGVQVVPKKVSVKPRLIGPLNPSSFRPVGSPTPGGVVITTILPIPPPMPSVQ
jgi:hypothetical protein